MEVETAPDGDKAQLTLQSEDEAAFVLRVGLDVRHERSHALLKHSPVGQRHGPELRKEVRRVPLGLHLLQGALHRPFSLSHPRGSPTRVSASTTKGKTIHLNLR